MYKQKMASESVYTEKYGNSWNYLAPEVKAVYKSQINNNIRRGVNNTRRANNIIKAQYTNAKLNQYGTVQALRGLRAQARVSPKARQTYNKLKNNIVYVLNTARRYKSNNYIKKLQPLVNLTKTPLGGGKRKTRRRN